MDENPYQSPKAEEGIKAGCLAPCLGMLALASCSIPFFRPLVFVALPLASLAVVLTARQRFRQRAGTGTTGDTVRTFVAIVTSGLALYLSLTDKHLIDFLEGF